MSEERFITKCCICGRQQTKNGWEFCGGLQGNDVRFSHGFCTTCYETELMKIKLRTFRRAHALSA